MQDLERKVYGTLVGGKGFIVERTAVLGNVPGNGACLKLDSIIAALAEHHSAQSEHRMTAQTLTQDKAATRRAVVQDHLAAISAVARTELPTAPGLAVVRGLPHANASVGSILTRAENVCKAVVPYVDVLAAGGLPADFLTQLQAVTDSLAQVAANHKTSRDKVGGATEGIRAQLAAGRRQIRILDRLVRTALRNADPALLKEWKERTALPRKTVTAVVATVSVTPALAPAAAA